MNIGIVIPAQSFLVLTGPGSQRFTQIAFGILAADHKSDLSGWIGGNGGVGIFDDGEDFFAGFFEVCDQGEVKPLVFGCNVLG
jgi:hypothetical protein